MNAIVKRFDKPRVLLPVVHAVTDAQTRTAVAVAVQNGADGVWLVAHGAMHWSRVVQLAQEAASTAAFVGVHLLGKLPVEALRVLTSLPGVEGLRCDTALAGSDEGRLLPFYRRAWKWPGLYFGGTAYKYEADVTAAHHPAFAKAVKAGGVDVVVAAGAVLSVEKVAVLHEALNDHALAVASGVTLENVRAYLPFVDAFLVSAVVEASFGVFEPARMRALANAVHGVS